MMRKCFTLGLLSVACVAGLCETSEAGHRHRCARTSGHQTRCAAVQPQVCQSANSGYYGQSNAGYTQSSGHNYGSNSYMLNTYDYNNHQFNNNGSSSYQGNGYLQPSNVNAYGNAGGNANGILNGNVNGNAGGSSNGILNGNVNGDAGAKVNGNVGGNTNILGR